MAFGDDQIDGYVDGEEPLVFHHKKGEFREKEPKIYSDLATNQNQPKKGLFRCLVNTKGNRIMFFTMVFCFVLVLIVSLLSDNPDECTVHNVSCQLSAFSYEDTIYASVKLKKSEKAESEIHSLHAVFIFYDADGNEMDKEVVDKSYDSAASEDEFIRCTHTDFDIKKIECQISCAQSEKSGKMTSSVQQR